jgi:hypothetical protein
MHHPLHRTSLKKQQKKENPSNPLNPLHPDETSVSVACPSGFSESF